MRTLRLDRTELIQTVYAVRELILDPARTEHDDPNGYVDIIRKLSHETTVPMAYIPGGGAVFFAGRDQHFGGASVKQQADCWESLQRLGFRRQRVIQVKSVDEAAAGATLTDAAVKARQASAGSFVEAKQRIYGDARTLYVRVFRSTPLTRYSHATHTHTLLEGHTRVAGATRLAPSTPLTPARTHSPRPTGPHWWRLWPREARRSSDGLVDV